MAVKVLSIYIVGLAIVATIHIASDLTAFLDVPSALFVGSSFGLLLRINWKIVSPMSEKVEGSDITGWELLGYTAISMEVIGSLIALTIMLGIWAFFLINSTKFIPSPDGIILSKITKSKKNIFKISFASIKSSHK